MKMLNKPERLDDADDADDADDDEDDEDDDDDDDDNDCATDVKVPAVPEDAIPAGGVVEIKDVTTLS